MQDGEVNVQIVRMHTSGFPPLTFFFWKCREKNCGGQGSAVDSRRKARSGARRHFKQSHKEK